MAIGTDASKPSVALPHSCDAVPYLDEVGNRSVAPRPGFATCIRQPCDAGAAADARPADLRAYAHRGEHHTGCEQGARIASQTRPVALPPLNSVEVIDGEPHRYLATTGDRMLFTLLSNSAIYLVHDSATLLAPPTIEHWAWLRQQGRARPVVDPAARLADEAARPPRELEIEKNNLLCDLLDRHQVPNGTKSIAIWLHANWSGKLLSRYGPASNAHTLKRWRSLRARAIRETALASSPEPPPT